MLPCPPHTEILTPFPLRLESKSLGLPFMRPCLGLGHCPPHPPCVDASSNILALRSCYHMQVFGSRKGCCPMPLHVAAVLCTSEQSAVQLPGNMFAQNHHPAFFPFLAFQDTL